MTPNHHWDYIRANGAMVPMHTRPARWWGRMIVFGSLVAGGAAIGGLALAIIGLLVTAARFSGMH